MVDLFKRLFLYTFVLFSFLCFLQISSFAESTISDSISAHAACVAVAETGEILYAKNETKELPMASTTKIMTSILALESGKMQQTILVEPTMIRTEGTSMGLLPGDLVDVKTLVYGMLLQSGNDAANVTAYAIAGGIAPFLRLMNQKAEMLHLTHTHFSTVSGLDAPEHYACAKDLAMLSAYALHNPDFCSICEKQQAAVYYGNPPYRRTLTNHNKFLKLYDGAIGVKTGFTKKSGRCLVTAAKRENATLICVTLNAPNDWHDHQVLLDYGFSKLQMKTFSLEEHLSIPVVGSKQASVSLYLPVPIQIPLCNTEQDVQLEIYKWPFLYAPLPANSVVGRVLLKNGNKIYLDIPLLTSETI